MTLDNIQAEIHYLIALSAASERDLSRAAMHARFSHMLCATEKASHLAKLCMEELGETPGRPVRLINVGGMALVAHTPRADDGLAGIRSLVKDRKWLAAACQAKALPKQSVRVLNMRGCIYAQARLYGKAIECFSKALEKDCGNRLAIEGLAEAIRRRREFWRFYERPLQDAGH